VVKGRREGLRGEEAGDGREWEEKVGKGRWGGGGGGGDLQLAAGREGWEEGEGRPAACCQKGRLGGGGGETCSLLPDKEDLALDSPVAYFDCVWALIYYANP